MSEIINNQTSPLKEKVRFIKVKCDESDILMHVEAHADNGYEILSTCCISQEHKQTIASVKRAGAQFVHTTQARFLLIFRRK